MRRREIKPLPGNQPNGGGNESGKAGFFSAILAGSAIYAGSALRDVAVIDIDAAVAAQSPATIIVEHRLFWRRCIGCVHCFSCLFQLAGESIDRFRFILTA
jgi:hypothetical protein